MGFTNKNLAETQDFGLAVDRTAHVEDTTISIVSIRQTHSLKDALAGLPDGHCACPHWGYMMSGSMTVEYGDRRRYRSTKRSTRGAVSTVVFTATRPGCLHMACYRCWLCGLVAGAERRPSVSFGGYTNGFITGYLILASQLPAAVPNQGALPGHSSPQRP
jgi:hypothetical protein